MNSMRRSRLSCISDRLPMTLIGHVKTTCVFSDCRNRNCNVIVIRYRIRIPIKFVFRDNNEFNIIFQFLIISITCEYVSKIPLQDT